MHVVSVRVPVLLPRGHFSHALLFHKTAINQYGCTVTAEVSANKRNALYSPHYLIGDGSRCILVLDAGHW